MEKKVILILIVLIILTGVAFFKIYYDENKSVNKDESSLSGIGENDSLDSNPGGVVNGGEANPNNNNEGGGDAGSSDGTSSDNSSPEEVSPENLPSDFYTVGCGYYFDEYERCGGSCPRGTCVSEGRSCYCKI